MGYARIILCITRQFLCFKIEKEITMNAIFEQRKYDSDFHVWTHTYRNLYSLTHYHPEVQIIRIQEGCTNITINQDTYFCHTGDILFCRGSEPHSVSPIPGQNCITDFIAISPTIFRYITRANYQVKRHIPLEELKKKGMVDFSNQVFSIVQKELKEKFHKKVELELYVRVEKNWRNRANKLQQLGYLELDDKQ